MEGMDGSDVGGRWFFGGEVSCKRGEGLLFWVIILGRMFMLRIGRKKPSLLLGWGRELKTMRINVCWSILKFD